MAKQLTLKTSESTMSVTDYIDSLSDEKARQEAKTLLRLFKAVTGMPAKMWGSSIVGFGKYLYHRSNGDEGEYLATGFSMRKSGPTIYIMPGYQDYSSILKDLGPHKLGKSCLYLKKLDEVDLTILQRLIKQGLADLKKTHKVS